MQGLRDARIIASPMPDAYVRSIQTGLENPEYKQLFPSVLGSASSQWCKPATCRWNQSFSEPGLGICTFSFGALPQTKHYPAAVGAASAW